MRLIFLLASSLLISTSLHAYIEIPTRFEQRCDGYIAKDNEVKCNSFIDKSLRKGKLSHEDSCAAYFYKCKLYLDYHNWNSRTHYYNRFKDTYPNPDDQWISIPDTLIKYSKLLLEHSGHGSAIYKRYLTHFYYYICAETMRSWDPITFVDSYYYRRNPKYCHDHLNRISQLKELVTDFPSINQFGFELYETNLMCQFGLIKDRDLNSIYNDVEFHTENRAENYRIAEKSSAFMNDHFYGFDIIQVQLANLIEYLFHVKSYQGRRLLDLIEPGRLDYYFNKSIFPLYDSYWQIDSNSKSHDLGLLDYRDSTCYDATVPIYVKLNIDFDIPTWDTVIIDRIKNSTNGNEQKITPVRLSGKGTTELPFTIEQYYWRQAKTLEYDLIVDLISNRGSKGISIQVCIILPESILENKKSEYD